LFNGFFSEALGGFQVLYDLEPVEFLGSVSPFTKQLEITNVDIPVR